MDRNQAKEFYPILQAFAEGKVIETRTDPNVVGKGLEDMNYWTEMNEIEHWNNIHSIVSSQSLPAVLLQMQKSAGLKCKNISRLDG